MKTFYALPNAQEISTPIVLTIGNFDGVHLGHKAILNRLNELSKQIKGINIVLTFSNHPSTVLNPDNPTPLLCSLNHKIQLMQQEKIDYLCILPFTKELSELSPEDFLHTIRKSIPFNTLVLGSDATIGKNRAGDRDQITKLSKTLHFDTEYLPDITLEGERISSSKIRDLIQQGQLQQAAKFLGRQFSIYSMVISGTGRGAKIGFPTANICIEGLCTPPRGVYAVHMIHDGKKHDGVANLGIAPTMRTNPNPIFEVHLFDHTENLYGTEVEVFFDQYIRPERRFDDINQLKLQIMQDIQLANQIHKSNVGR